MYSTTKLLLEAKSRLDKKAGNLDLSMVASRKAVSHNPLEAISTMTKDRVRGTFLCEEKRQELLGAYPV
jgi:hypothetical protein